MNGVEIELKFQAPPSSRAALLQAFSTATSRALPLHALYFDTADERLAAAGFALRLRREGRRWVQTLKGRGDGMLVRPEHEVALAPQRGLPVPEIARHAGTAAGDAVAALLADDAPLLLRYTTQVRRRLRVLRHAGARVEAAFDEGHIAAGARRAAVLEVEFELLSGPPAALVDLAAAWAQRHALWLDVRTKSERGHRLAKGLERVPATKARPMVLAPAATPGQAFAATLQAALAHLLPNAAELAAGTGEAEHLHQLRVALRRLRTALRLFAGWSADPAAAQALEEALREPFTRLGAVRDDDVLAPLLSALAAAGAPPLPWAPSVSDDAATAWLREPAFTLLLLRVLALVLALAPAAGPAAPLSDAAQALLAPLWRQIRADARRFESADAAARHRTRRRLKRLRYATEFLQPALPRKSTREALAAMSRALDALGECNDAAVAEARFRAAAATDPRAWFAVGWLAARQQVLLERADRRLRKLRRLRVRA